MDRAWSGEDEPMATDSSQAARPLLTPVSSFWLHNLSNHILSEDSGPDCNKRQGNQASVSMRFCKIVWPLEYYRNPRTNHITIINLLHFLRKL